MNLDLMLLIEKQFLDTPFYGVRQMTWHLQNEGHAVNEERIRRLMAAPESFITRVSSHWATMLLATRERCPFRSRRRTSAAVQPSWKMSPFNRQRPPVSGSRRVRYSLPARGMVQPKSVISATRLARSGIVPTEIASRIQPWISSRVLARCGGSRTGGTFCARRVHRVCPAVGLVQQVAKGIAGGLTAGRGDVQAAGRGQSATCRMDERRPGIRRRLVQGSVGKQGYTPLHPRPEDPRQGSPI